MISNNMSSTFPVFLLLFFQLSGQNVISNVKENVVNIQDGNSSVNSGIIINNGKTAGGAVTLTGNGDYVNTLRKLPAFESISVRGSFDVNIKLLPACRNEIQINADSNLTDNVKAIVEKGELKIFPEKSYSSSLKISIILKASSLGTLSVEGANSITAGPLASDIFTLKSPGGCNTISFSGTVRELNMQLGGASKLDAGQLCADNAALNLSGAAEAVIQVKNTIKLKASGAAKVFYVGKPSEIIKELAGAAKLLPYEFKNK